MKVVCKVKNLNDITDVYTLERLKKYISKSDGEVDLDIGKEYNVYGVVFWDNCPWFYLCTEDYDEYPKPFSSEFFEIIDSNLSKYWKLSVHAQGEYETATSLVFNEWAEDPCFYEKLIEGDTEAVYLFSKYRRIIDQEQSDS